jgi:acyl dehydratase
MPVLAYTVGADLGTCEFEVTPRRALAFAAALGVTSGASLDDAAPDFAALPQFCVVAEWPWASDPARMRAIGLDAREASRALHVAQDSHFHRPVRPGSRLRVSGRLAEVRAARSGTLTVSRIETVDAETGDPVATSWSRALFRGVALEGEPRCAESAPTDAGGPGPAEGGSEILLPVARELGHVYTECTGIWNPIHTERRVALAMGLPDIILHGTATWALAGREIVRHFAAGEPRRLRRLAGEFRAVIVPGCSVRLRHSAAVGADGVTIVRFIVLNAAGQTAIADGVAEIAPAAETPAGPGGDSSKYSKG